MVASTSTAPGGNWAKLQTTLKKDKLVAASSPTRSRKGKEPMREGADFSTSPFASDSGYQKKKYRMNGIADLARMTGTNESSSSKVTIDTRTPVHEEVVFKPLPENANPMVVELREMVAGRNPLNDNKRAPGNYVSIDCEMVGLGHLGSESSLARVSLVNYHGHILYDTFVQQKERVTDWRTWVSGIKETDLVGAPTFETVQKKVAELIEGRILVGHAIENDLKALLLDHPGPMTRDTQKCKALRERAKNKRPGLKKLSVLELGLEIQKASHSSVTDARATMALYRLHKLEWEKELRPFTEAWKAKHGSKGVDEDTTKSSKRKRKAESNEDEDEDDEENPSHRKRSNGGEFPGGGRKGVSSGLGLIVRRGGKRIDNERSKKQSKDNEETDTTEQWWKSA